MSYLLKQSQTARPLLFLMVQSADHLSGLTSASPTVTLSKNGAAFGSPSGAVTELSSGWYKVAGNATDTATLGPLLLHATAASGDPTDVQFEVVSFDPEDATRLGLTAMPNANAGANGGLPTGNASGQVVVSSHASGAIAAASFASGAIDATAIATDAIGSDELAATAASEIALAVWAALTSALTTTGSIGKRLADDIDATISSRLDSSSYTAPDNTTIAAIAGYVDTEVAAIKAKTDNLPSAPAAVSDIPTAAQIRAEIDSNSTKLDATVSSRAAAADYTPTRAAKLDYLDAAISSRSSHSAADVWTAGSRSLSTFGTLVNDIAIAVDVPTVGEIADAVFDEPSADHDTSGSMGAKLNAAGSAADPLENDVPGDYAAGTAGYALGNLSIPTADAILITYTVKDTDNSTPLADVDVWFSTDSGGSNVVARGRTDAFGVVQPKPELDAGTYRVWRQKSGKTFSNPVTAVVS